MPDCIFAPHFPPEDPQKFANVHKIFGASNVTKLLNDLLPHQRDDAVNSLAYEAEARVRDPVYGCVGAISFLQRQVERLETELDAANADLIRYASFNDDLPHQAPMVGPPPPPPTRQRPSSDQLASRRVLGNEGGGGGGGFYQTPSNFPFPYHHVPWDYGGPCGGDINGGGQGSV